MRATHIEYLIIKIKRTLPSIATFSLGLSPAKFSTLQIYSGFRVYGRRDEAAPAAVTNDIHLYTEKSLHIY